MALSRPRGKGWLGLARGVASTARRARAPAEREEDASPKKRPGHAAPVREDRKDVADYFGDLPFFTGLKPVIFSTSSVA